MPRHAVRVLEARFPLALPFQRPCEHIKGQLALRLYEDCTAGRNVKLSGRLCAEAWHAGLAPQPTHHTYNPAYPRNPVSREVPVQRHLQRVYATLTVSLAITALGAYMDMVYGISGFLTSIGAFGCLLGLVWTPSSPATLVRSSHSDTKSLCGGVGHSVRSCGVHALITLHPGEGSSQWHEISGWGTGCRTGGVVRNPLTSSTVVRAPVK